MSSVLYNVQCLSCGSVSQPMERTPLWWQAKQRSDKGFLDALRISGQECGCVEKQKDPNAPFRVFGYDMGTAEYDIPCRSFTKAVKLFKNFNQMGDVVFIVGVSEKVQQKIKSL